jgi:hypothetical protein
VELLLSLLVEVTELRLATRPAVTVVEVVEPLDGMVLLLVAVELVAQLLSMEPQELAELWVAVVVEEAE